MKHSNNACGFVPGKVLTTVWVFVAASAVWGASPLENAWTYQGELKQNGSRVSDTCDCAFSLWDSATGGLQIGSTLTFDGQGANPPPIDVSDGLLTVELDFGAGAFDGHQRWLEIAVACPSGSSLESLAPRRPITAAPYALALPAMRIEQTASSPNVIGGYIGNSVAAPYPGATISGGGADGFENQVTFSFGTIGGGAGNLAEGHSSTVAGGRFNIAGEDQSTVGGGQSNTARRNGTVAGGSGNTAFNLVLGGATVAGGLNNAATGGSSAIGGGETNTADGHFATVPGGRSNQAGADYSFAGGRRAIVRTAGQVGGGDLDGDQGTFVWADSANADFVSTGPDQFLIRAAGGMGLNRNNPAHPIHVGTDGTNGNGAHLTAGGTWTNSSDRNAKHRFEEIDVRDILHKVSELPITRWQYKGEPDPIRHIGPVAQDFHAAFHLGSSDTHIGTVDSDGVALAAIQGLHEILKEKESEIAAQRRQIAELTARLEKVETLLANTTQ